MRTWSFPVGRYLGVEVRIHAFFLLLLGTSITFAEATGSNGTRGFTLWLMLFFAVVLREIARAIAAASFGLELRSVLLLPTGGLPTYATQDDTARAAKPAIEKRMAVVGPLANIATGLILFGMMAGIAPGLGLLDRPWVTPDALLRSFAWTQVLLGAINFLPVAPLDGGRVLRGGFSSAGGGIASAQQAIKFGQYLAIGMVIMGIVLVNLVLMLIGIFVLVAAHLEDQGVLLQTKVDSVRMKDVMLTEYTTLSASATLEDALEQAIHSLQDVFPVVRAGNLVGAVSRQGIFEALQTDGNGYVQGVMTRSFHTAQPDDSLLKTLQRITNGVGAQLVPVVEGERVIGIITPQNLSQSMSILNQSKKLQERNARASQQDQE
ncbi:CBS domain-containing protein [Granulicella aggregans]|uniref:Zinc metalloprotease n=1 Tax=Granulicella aggregans TaxID=474949 RepID=A0A7W8E2Q0_9BACT|nr:CBS domain-containing protein [Granulicella aggregans]MBB5056777.1 CBS domain-containing protein [Granulicella aggregans]